MKKGNNMKFKDFIKEHITNKIYESGDWGAYGSEQPEEKWYKEQPYEDPAAGVKPKKIKNYGAGGDAGGEEKPEKEIKKFEVGDVIVLVDTKRSSKIPDDAWDFLTTFKTYTVLKVSEKGKLDLGCKISKNEPTGGVEKTFLFSPNRFELKSKVEGNITPLENDEESEQ